MKNIRSQDELGRKEWVMNKIMSDSTNSLDDELISLYEMSEDFINSIYEISQDEMSKDEILESVMWIEKQLKNNIVTL